MPVTLYVDGRTVEVVDEAATLLAVLRDQLAIRSVKDGCSPQGQCGCCTVLVDGVARVACVTPVRRLSGRRVTTVDGLDPEVAARWAEAFAATGASQCGFCSPGIILRLVAEADKPSPNPAQALLAHLCRCTGWQPIVEAFALATGSAAGDAAGDGQPVPWPSPAGRDLAAAARRAELEGRVRQQVGPAVALGRGGFADDGAPADALVAVPDGSGGWATGASLADARRAAGKIQGRRTTVAPPHPVELPPGSWDVALQTSWVDPAYLETDASWCVPGGEPAGALGNGGAFGGKLASPVAEAARELAASTGRPVRVLWSREDVVANGPKRPPIAAGIDLAARRVVVRVARTEAVAERLQAGFAAAVEAADAAGALRPGAGTPELVVEEVDVAGPPTSVALRAAGWAEGVVLGSALWERAVPVRQPGGGTATCTIGPDGAISVEVDAGEVLDEIVLRSYCIGAVHLAASLVSAECLTVSAEGTVQDLTVRSLGVLRAVDLPPVHCAVRPAAPDAVPLAVSDAVFAVTAAAVWAAHDRAPSWPTRRPLR